MPKQRRSQPAILVAAFLFSSACHSLAAAQSNSPTVSDAARKYLESVLSLVETNSINRAQIDWSVIRSEALSRAAGAKVESDTYPAIKWVVSSLGDRHSAFLDPAALKSMPARSAAASGVPQSRILADRFGYVSLPTFGSPDQATIDKFATDVQIAIGAVRASNPCGWVVDLRSNGGGNMWAMLAGIGPVLGTDVVGSFRAPDGTGASWAYANGEAKSDGRTLAKTLNTPVHLQSDNAPVVVLIGEATASSGEAVAIAFRGRPYTRLFGAKTRGLATSNRVFPLSDGALLNLTTAAFADRTGATYIDGVTPDESWDKSLELSRDSVPLAWLAAQPACRGGHD